MYANQALSNADLVTNQQTHEKNERSAYISSDEHSSVEKDELWKRSLDFYYESLREDEENQ